MDEQSAQILNWVALLGAPVVAGGLSAIRALDSETAVQARKRGLLGTLLVGVVLASVAGVVIDVLHPGFMPPATFVLAALEVPLSAGVGFLVGRACARSVSTRHGSHNGGNERMKDG